MKLLNYTEKLAKKIQFYDNIAKESLKKMTTNPFFKKYKTTIIWITEVDIDKND
ncbi:hypothetical protein IJF81_05705 [bacterium]|nr:hypothetical protein [bacterium]